MTARPSAPSADPLPIVGHLAGWCRSALLVAAVLLAALSAALVAPPPAAAQAAAQGDEAAAQAMAEFMERYYRNPQPLQAVDRMVDLDVGIFIQAARDAAEAQGVAILSTFMAHVLRANPDLVPVLAGRLAAAGRPRNALIGAHAIVTADGPTVPAALDTLAAAGLLDGETRTALTAAPGYPFPRMQAQTHFDIDIFWTSFFATGDRTYVEKVAEALTYWESDAMERLPREYPALSDEAQAMAIIEVTMAIVAHGTLTTNARRHPAVLSALDALSAARSDKVGVIAGSIAATVRAGG